MDVIKLLRSKNRCLQRILDLSSMFDDLEHVHVFVDERNAHFKALDLYDRKITEAIQALPLSERTPELIAQTKTLLDQTDYLVQAITLKDNELMARIEQKQRSLLEEVGASKKNRDLVGKFRSKWVAENGEELDKTL